MGHLKSVYVRDPDGNLVEYVKFAAENFALQLLNDYLQDFEL